jgi:EAL domain-containing protein (putative c-di-GMP-specific phosphodiesterase class I)
VKLVREILDETGVAPQHLEMELTESILMHNEKAAIAILRGMKSIGVRLSLDDFGTGYSSLNCLSRLPIDALKIDKSFVQHIGDQEHSDERILVQAIISLGHSLNLRVIAEGVETATQLQFLEVHRCDEVQGFYFGKPMPADEFTQFLVKQRSGAKRLLTASSTWTRPLISSAVSSEV